MEASRPIYLLALTGAETVFIYLSPLNKSDALGYSDLFCRLDTNLVCTDEHFVIIMLFENNITNVNIKIIELLVRIIYFE